MPNTDNSLLQKILNYIETERLAVLSTADDTGEPHGAAVYLIVSQDNLLCFITRKESLKFKNIIKRPEVNLTLVNATEASTLQIDGEAAEINDKDKINYFVKELEAVTHPDDTLEPLKEVRFALVGVKIMRARLTEYAGNNMFDSHVTEVG